MKLATELAKKDTGKTLYILDEPTTGLHFEDINRLLNVLQALVEQGNTVIVIEHNLDVIKVADYIVDMGPGAGINGGNVVAAGTPEEIMANENSLTGKYLSHKLEIPVPTERRKGKTRPSLSVGARKTVRGSDPRHSPELRKLLQHSIRHIS